MHTQNHGFQKTKVFRNFQSNKCIGDLQQFAGIAGASSEDSQFVKLTAEPSPLAVIEIKLEGALFNDAVFLERSSIERILLTVLRPLTAVMANLQARTGSSMAAFKISKIDSQIVVLPRSVLSDRERFNFFEKFGEQLAVIEDEIKIVRHLAELPAEKFGRVWFRDGVRPSGELLPALKGIVALEQALAKTHTYFCMNGVRVDLPKTSGLKLVKKAGCSRDLVGTIRGLNSKLSTIVVQADQESRMVTLQALGKGYIDELNQKFRIGDRVRIAYEPTIDLLKPFEPIPGKGRLLQIDAT